MTKTRAITVILSLFMLVGCASSYEHVVIDPTRHAVDDARSLLGIELMNVLYAQNGDPLAQAVLGNQYAYGGFRATDDGRNLVYMFQATTINLSKYAFAAFLAGDDPYITTEQNTDPNVAYSNDGDAKFKGTYKLTLYNTVLCTGQTPQEPKVEGNDVNIVFYSNLYDHTLRGRIIAPYHCMGRGGPEAYEPDDRGARFFFVDAGSMERFASILMGAFPQTKYRNQQTKPE